MKATVVAGRESLWSSWSNPLGARDALARSAPAWISYNPAPRTIPRMGECTLRQRGIRRESRINAWAAAEDRVQTRSFGGPLRPGRGHGDSQVLIEPARSR